MQFILPSGHIGLIDEQDAWLLQEYSWHIINGYVQAETGNRKAGSRKTFRLHRLIMQPNSSEIIDHINRNPLDNRRANLRIANRSTNGMNRGAQINNTSGYKGVSLHAKTGKWRSYITVGQKTTHLGLFATPELAHEAYAEASRVLHREFSCV